MCYLAEVKFIEHLGTKHAIENRKTVFETLVENPHNRPVTWYRNGQEIKPEDRYDKNDHHLMLNSIVNLL